MYSRFTIVMILAAVTWPVGAAGPVGWRSDGTGRYPDADPPVQWGPQQNVVWVTPMPSDGNCTPVIWGDRIFVTAEEAELLCVNKADGRIIWQASNDYDDFMTPADLAQIAKATELNDKLQSLKQKRDHADGEIKKLERAETIDEPKVAQLKADHAQLEGQIAELNADFDPVAQFVKRRPHELTGYATATPVTDGQNVCVVFGTGVAACYDTDEGRRWIRRIDASPLGFGHSASPLLVDHMLIVHMKDVVALDVNSGAEIWRTSAPIHQGSPVLAVIGGEKVVVTPHGEFIRAGDGKNLAFIPAHVDRISPLVHDGVVYFAGTSDKAVMAVKLPEKAEPFTPEILWKFDNFIWHGYSSPAWNGDLLYVLESGKKLHVVDAPSGEHFYQEQLKGLGGTAYSSVSIAGDYVYLSSEAGATQVVRTGKKYEVVAQNDINDKMRSSLVFEGTRLYLRTMKNLYCIGR